MEPLKDLLSVCLTEIEHRLQWGDSSVWTGDDFEKLSEKIWEKTEVRLSLSTLRRLWGRVRYESNPNAHTLNALARFIDFSDWREFSVAQRKPLDKPQISSPVASTDKPSRMNILVIALIGVMIVSVIIISLRYKAASVEKNYAYQFSLKHSAPDLPNSVVFGYDAGPRASQVEIQQSWDKSRTEKVDPKGHLHTSLYYIPGYFRAKLLVEGNIVRQLPLLIPSNGWKAMAGRTGIPIYFSEKTWRKSVRLALTPAQLSAAVKNTELNNQWSQFTYVEEMKEVDSADFSVTAEIRNNTTVEQSLCRRASLNIIGKNYPVMIPLSDKGCISGLNLAIGDSVVDGKKHDLTAFGCDFSKAQIVKCIVKERQLTIEVNGSIAYSMHINQLPGGLVGVRVLFEGGGELTKMMIGSNKKVIDLLTR